MLKFLSHCLTFSLLLSKATFTDKPTFESYLIAEQYKGELNNINLESHADVNMFKNHFIQLKGEVPNFAGKYIVTSWGCGTSCQTIAVVDVSNGDVFFIDQTASHEYCYQINSNLLIINPITQDLYDSFDGEIPKWLKTKYYLWDGKKFNLLSESQTVISLNC